MLTYLGAFEFLLYQNEEGKVAGAKARGEDEMGTTWQCPPTSAHPPKSSLLGARFEPQEGGLRSKHEVAMFRGRGAPYTESTIPFTLHT